jgi:hypothetical protein
VVALALGAVTIAGLRSGDAVLAGTSAGGIAGLAFSIGWALHRYLPRVALGLAALGFVLIMLAFRRAAGIEIAAAVALLVLLIWIAGYDFYYSGRFHRETVTPVVPFGPEGGKRILIAYHSAHHGFQCALQTKLAQRLAETGLRVDLTTASTKAPSDIAGYDLIVFGAPAYNWIPAWPVTAYIRRLRNLHGKQIVLIVSGGGMTAQAMERLREEIEAAHGRLIDELEVWVARPNPPRFGATEPDAIISGLAADLARRLD